MAAPSESTAPLSTIRREMRRRLFMIDSHQSGVIGMASSTAAVEDEGPLAVSPVRELGENVIVAFRQCVTRKPALRVVALRRRCRLGSRAKRIGRCVVVE